MIHTVEPSRLAWGVWDGEKEKTIGEGDIHKAYSGDSIADGKIRGVIAIEGQPYTVVGVGEHDAHLWPLFTVAQWGNRPSLTYGERTASGEFTYEGIRVKRGQDVYIMGPRDGEITVKAAEAAPEVSAAQDDTTASDDDGGGDDLCDLCHASDVHVDRTTYCGKTIGIECGCEESNEAGVCLNSDCAICTASVGEEDYDDDGEEPEPEALTLAPTPPPLERQMNLF